MPGQYTVPLYARPAQTTPSSGESHEDSLKSRDEALLKQAQGALVLAKYAIEEWGSYASEKIQQEYDLAGDIAATDATITAIRARLNLTGKS